MGTKECEICGREAYNLFLRKIEGVVMNVCGDCKNLGEEPEIDRSTRTRTKSASKFQSLYSTSQPKPRKHRPPSTQKSYQRRDNLSNLKIIDNATDILAECRKKNKLSSKDFANSLFIKENYYNRIEKGTTSLKIELARKIEKKYKIKLVEKEEYDEEDDYSKYQKKNKDASESMIYFKKRGQKPEY